MSVSSNQRIVLITGANRSIGFEAVKILAQQHPNDVVLLATRSIKNGEQAVSNLKQQGVSVDNVKVVQLDVSDQKSIDTLAEKVKADYGGLDVLVNNAALLTHDPNQAESMFDANIAGVQRMNDAFLPLLLARSQVTGKKPINVIVSSMAGSFFNYYLLDERVPELLLSAPDTWSASTPGELSQDFINQWQGKPHQHNWEVKPFMDSEYAATKAILSGYSRWYAKQHPELDVAVVCPNYCDTDMNGHKGIHPPSRGAASILWPLDNKFESGHFYQDAVEIEWSMKLPF